MSRRGGERSERSEERATKELTVELLELAKRRIDELEQSGSKHETAVSTALSSACNLLACLCYIYGEESKVPEMIRTATEQITEIYQKMVELEPLVLREQRGPGENDTVN